MSELGKFITFDGIDGAGKSTQINHLAESLKQNGQDVYVTREPGGTELAEAIRTLLLDNRYRMSTTAELLLMFAARAEHVEQVLKPKIAQGVWVICSRFTDATLAYQGYARGADIQVIEQIATIVHGDFQPDLSVFLDLSVEQALKRRQQRGEPADRFESEALAFMQAVRDGYLQIARNEPTRCMVLDAMASENELSQIIWDKVTLLA